MESRFTLMALLVSGVLLAICHAQSMSSYQTVGEDYGRTWLADFEAQNPSPKTEEQSSTGLWTWGGAPKGRVIQNGKLVPDPYTIWRSLNYTSGWLGEAYIDPKTGNPVYAYIDPYTGNTVYFYVDPKTGSPVTLKVDAGTGNSAIPFYSSSDSNSGQSASSMDPWADSAGAGSMMGYPRVGLPRYGDSLGSV